MEMEFGYVKTEGIFLLLHTYLYHREKSRLSAILATAVHPPQQQQGNMWLVPFAHLMNLPYSYII